MDWEEKIDRLKAQFPKEDFRVPFSDWSEILKKLEARFVISAKPGYEHTNWSEGLKERVALRTIDRLGIEKSILMLNPLSNYWVIVVHGESSMARQFVYDCRPISMEHLIAIAPADFYIADKKYGWLAYFNVRRSENKVTLFKAGDSPTPFDPLP